MFPLIHDGKVIQLADAVFEVNPALTWGPPQDGVQVGDSYDGTSFTHLPAPPPAVPQTVSKVQAVLALHAVPGSGSGTLLDDVNAAVAEAADPRVALAWNNATQIDRNGTFIASVAKGAPLNMTDEQLDALFTAAALIVV